jgi:hypothetical protein
MAALDAHLATYLMPEFGASWDQAAVASGEAVAQRGLRINRGSFTN